MNTRLYLIKKKWEVVACIAFIIGMSGYSGFYFGWIGHQQTESFNPPKGPVLDTVYFRQLSADMDEAIGSCYYETYQNNDSFMPGTADSCDKLMMSYKKLCEALNVEACHNDYLKKYLAGMGE